MKTCIVCGRECERLTKKMCDKHYQQYRKYGKCLDSNPRTKFDPNEVILHEDYAEIVLYDKSNNEIARAVIDIEDVERVRKLKWYLDSSGYIAHKSSKCFVFLHRLITNCPIGMYVDHINHNTMDNRHENLRVCTSSQNNMNKDKPKNNTSGVKGVYWDKDLGKWKSSITIEGKLKHLGVFANKEEAIYSRKIAEEKYYGDYKYKEVDIDA